jgi:hypothetical protein
MQRRDFLLLGTGGGVGVGRPAVLSCERLYMRYVDAQAEGRTADLDDLFNWLARDLGRVKTVRLTDTSWLSCEELNRRLDLILDQFRARGGRVLTDR